MVTKKSVEKIVQKGSSKIPIKWDLAEAELPFAKKDDGSLAIYGCGCSSFELNGKCVEGSYNLVLDQDVEKTFTVFLEDGAKLEIPNNKGVNKPNFSKRHIQLHFKLIVKD